MRRPALFIGLVLGLLAAAVAQAQEQGLVAQPRGATVGIEAPPDYVIGPSDVLSIVFWRDESMTTEVVVRPDGKISLPLINDVHAAGLTPEKLREQVTELSSKFLQDPAVSVVVKIINSRVVFITGNVGKGGTYPLMAPTTVLQLIAMAGGLTEWARQDGIVILRNDNGKHLRFPFNYRWVLEGKNPRQNIELKPGDTILVP